jgi:hypothetical protein
MNISFYFKETVVIKGLVLFVNIAPVLVFSFYKATQNHISHISRIYEENVGLLL